jgi:hypothetical protein
MGSSPRSYRDYPQQYDSSSSTSPSTSSNGSDRSRSTAPTIYTPYSRQRYREINEYCYNVDARESVDTYASTVASLAEDVDKEPPLEVVHDRYEDFPTEAIASTPPSFGELFPSTRKLLIKHDDATVDGNMNLRVDTIVSDVGGHQHQIILFHLRMHELHNRKFSFRRYCRESGKEVCHSTRKYRQPAAEKRPAFQRPLSSAFATLRSKSEANTPTLNSLRRQDSGYKSGTEEGWFDDRKASAESLPSKKSAVPTNTIQLEFSNYAHVDVKRRSSKGSKRYDFEYWSTRYQWRRAVRKDGTSKEISYHLINATTSKPVAHIVPESLTPLEAVEEESKGGWVTPSSMWISDPSVFERMEDVAE